MNTTHYDYFTGRILKNRPNPVIKKNVFSENDFENIKIKINNEKETSFLNYEKQLGRFSINKDNFFKYEHHYLVDIAREIFNSKELIPTYCLYAQYHGSRANLPYHIDDNACSYTIDLCVSYKTNWPIFIDNVAYMLEPNEAACYYGEDQYHWRDDFPDPLNNEVEMIFFHFAEPDHWYFTKGKDHLGSILEKRMKHQRSLARILANNISLT